MLRVRFSQFLGLFRKRKSDQDLDEEMLTHLDMATEENLRRGMSPEEARHAARRSFGGVEQVKETYRDARGIRWLEASWRDIRYGARRLRRNLSFTAVAVLTLALGIGANSAIFSVIHAVMLKPLPYPESERLVQIWTMSPPPGVPANDSNLRESISRSSRIEEWRDGIESFEEIGYYEGHDFTLTGAGEPERIEVTAVSAGLFDVLGVQPLMGRGFREEEMESGRDRVVILSDTFWTERFGADPSILAQTITLNGNAHTIIGVMPPDFRLILPWAREDSAFYAPISATFDRGKNWTVSPAVGRLRAGVSVAAAQDEMNGLVHGLQPDISPGVENRGVLLVPVSAEIGDSIRPALWVLLGAAFCVLLIACVNLANLLLASTMTRSREIGVRAVLGAGRGSLVRQLLAETLGLSLLGGAAGLICSHWIVRLIVGLYPGEIPRSSELQPDWTIFLFSLALAVVTSILIGVLPAIRFSRPDISTAIKTSTVPAGGTGSPAKVRNVLIASEVALAIVLLAGAGLLLRSFVQLRAVDPSFRTERLIVLDLVLPQSGYGSAPSQVQFVNRLLERVESSPGVRSAGITNSLPMVSNFMASAWFTIPGRTIEDRRPFAQVFTVTPDYLRTMGIPLLSGRGLEPADAKRDDVALINQSIARTYFGTADPLGCQIAAGGDTFTIVGVVGNVKTHRLQVETGFELYLPFEYVPGTNLGLAIHTDLGLSTLLPAIRAELQALDPDLPIVQSMNVNQVLSEAVAEPRFRMSLLGVLAGLALLLAGIGIYGVTSYSVTQRTREFGVRMALGAQRSDVLWLVVARGLWPPAIGIVFGLAGALAVTPVLRSVLYGVEPHDPVTYAAIAFVVLVICVTAGLAPALRATRVNPMNTLRYE